MLHNENKYHVQSTIISQFNLMWPMCEILGITVPFPYFVLAINKYFLKKQYVF
jgi:hypothetical protein